MLVISGVGILGVGKETAVVGGHEGQKTVCIQSLRFFSVSTCYYFHTSCTYV